MTEYCRSWASVSTSRGVAQPEAAAAAATVSPEVSVRLLKARSIARDRGVLIGPGKRIALLDRGMPRPIGIEEMGAREHAEIGAPGHQDAVDIGIGLDVADGHRRDLRLVANAVGEGRLEEPTIDRLLIGHGLPRGDIDDVASSRLQGARNGDGIAGVEAAGHPVGRGNANAHWFVPRPLSAHGVEDFERKAQAVLKAAAILVLA